MNKKIGICIIIALFIFVVIGVEGLVKSKNETSKLEESQNKVEDEFMKEDNVENIVNEAENNSNKTPAEVNGKLSVKGKNIVNKNEEKFVIQGDSTHGIAWFPQYVNEETFKTLRDDFNVNTIRIAMYSNQNDGYNESLHTKVSEGVEYAKNLGMYVIIDWHILNDNNPNQNKESAKNFFYEMTEKYKDYNNVIYEICNEPNGSVQWEKDIKPYAKELITTIREKDKDAIIIVGTPTWSQDVDIVSKSPIEGENNIVYALHFYAATHKDDLRNKLKNAHEKGLPIFVTEFGISDASGNGTISESEGDKWIDLLNSYNISWVCWNLSNKNETSAILNSNCNKTTGFQERDFSQQGKWLLKKLK